MIFPRALAGLSHNLTQNQWRIIYSHNRMFEARVQLGCAVGSHVCSASESIYNRL